MTPSNSSIRIATRESRLALWQAEHVQACLQDAHPGLDVSLVPMTTKGDQMLDSPLARIGGKGLFVKELELALLEGRADIAVHSMKDVPAQFPEGLQLPIIMQRADPLDAFVSNQYAKFRELPQGAKVGTASLRRQTQLLHLRPDLQIETLRGNVQTRLQKLDDGQYDAIILACAGLRRLGLEERIAQSLAVEDSLPAIGQGAIGIECREGDAQTLALLAVLHDADTATCLIAERAINARMGGNCTLPLAGYATLSDSQEGQQMRLAARMGSPDGKTLLATDITGPANTALAMGQQAANELLAMGADKILQDLGLPIPD